MQSLGRTLGTVALFPFWLLGRTLGLLSAGLSSSAHWIWDAFNDGLGAGKPAKTTNSEPLLAAVVAWLVVLTYLQVWG